MPRARTTTGRRAATPAARTRTSVRGSRSGRPIMQVLDVLGRRWALRVGWELRNGPQSFNELQRACDDISPSVLSQRLREGVDLGSIDRAPDGRYRLTSAGRSLLQILRRLDGWAARLRPRSTRTRKRS